MYAGMLTAVEVAEQYDAIGGGSPIKHYTDVCLRRLLACVPAFGVCIQSQGSKMVELLDTLSPDTGPHEFYTCFRYAAPLADDVVARIKHDGVR